MYAWSHDQAPLWAKTVFLWTGLIAGTTFAHACIATQVAANSYHSGESQRQAVGVIYRTAAACSAAGAFAGTLLAFSAAADLPPEIKLTTLVSDLAVVGTIAGLAVAAPIFVAHTWRAFKWLAVFDKRKLAELMLVLFIFDGWALRGIVQLLPRGAEILAFILSFV